MQKAFELLVKTGQITPGSTQYEQALENIRKKSVEARDASVEFRKEFDKILSSAQGLPDSFGAVVDSFTNLVVEGQKIKLAAIEYENFNKQMTEVEATMARSSDWPKDIKLLADNWIIASNNAKTFSDAAKTLGITLESDVRKGVESAKKAYDDIKNSGVATPKEISLAWDAYYVKEIEARKKFGQDIDGEEIAFYNSAKKRLDNYQKGSTDSWDLMAKQVSTIMTDLGNDIADTLTTMVTNWDWSAKNITKLFEDVGKAIVRIIVETAFKDIFKGLQDLDLSFINFGKSVTSIFTSIGKNIAGIFGVGGAAAGKAAEGAAGAAGSAGSAAGSAAGGLTNVFGMVTGVIDTIFGGLQYLQGRRMEQDIGRIEVTSREIKAETMNRRKDAWDQFNQIFGRMGEIWQSMMDKFDLLIQTIQQGIGTKPISEAVEEVVDATHPIREATEEGGRRVREAIDSWGQTLVTTGEGTKEEVKNIAVGSERTANAIERTEPQIQEQTEQTRNVVSGTHSISAGLIGLGETITTALTNVSEEFRKVNGTMDASALQSIINGSENFSEAADKVMQYALKQGWMGRGYNELGLAAYARMIEELKRIYGVSDATYNELSKGKYVYLPVMNGIGESLSKGLIPEAQRTSAAVESAMSFAKSTAAATAATLQAIPKLGFDITQSGGIIGSNIVQGIAGLRSSVIEGVAATISGFGIHIGASTTSMLSSMSTAASALADPAERTAAATEQTVQAVHQSAATFASGLSSLGMTMASLRDLPQAAAPIVPVVTPTVTSTPIGGGFGSVVTTPTTTPVTTTQPRTAGGFGAVTTQTPVLPQVTVDDTRKILEGSRFLELLEQPWRSNDAIARSQQATSTATAFDATAYQASVDNLKKMADQFAIQAKQQAEQEARRQEELLKKQDADRQKEQQKLADEQKAVQTQATSTSINVEGLSVAEQRMAEFGDRIAELMKTLSTLTAGSADYEKTLQQVANIQDQMAAIQQTIANAEPAVATAIETGGPDGLSPVDYTKIASTNIPSDLGESWAKAIEVNTSALDRNTVALGNRQMVIRVEATTLDEQRIARAIQNYLQLNSAVLA